MKTFVLILSVVSLSLLFTNCSNEVKSMSSKRGLMMLETEDHRINSKMHSSKQYHQKRKTRKEFAKRNKKYEKHARR